MTNTSRKRRRLSVKNRGIKIDPERELSQSRLSKSFVLREFFFLNVQIIKFKTLKKMNSRILDECLDRETIVISVRNRIGKIIASAVSERMAKRERERKRVTRIKPSTRLYTRSSPLSNRRRVRSDLVWRDVKDQPKCCITVFAVSSSSSLS